MMLCMSLNLHVYLNVQLEDESDVQKKSRELNARVSKRQLDVQQINAPNMKADEK